jgi:hypothetical protein
VLNIPREEALEALGWQGLTTFDLPSLVHGENNDVTFLTHAVDYMGEKLGWSEKTRRMVLEDAIEMNRREQERRRRMQS